MPQLWEDSRLVRVKVRFAPSPTGKLHIGNLRTAAVNWIVARQQQGTFLLRFEDSDPSRSSQESVQDILSALQWMNLSYDEGPYHQKDRLPRYSEVAESLLSSGKAYPCFCTPEELEAERKIQRARDLPPRYSRKCRTLSPFEVSHLLSAKKPYAVRFRTPSEGSISWEDRVKGKKTLALSELDDFILVRQDGTPTFLLANPVDDLDMGITLVIRGEDHLVNTAKHLLIFRALNASPPEYAHIPLVMMEEGRKASKRVGDLHWKLFQEEGILPDALLNYLLLLGWSPEDGQEILTREELIEKFQLERIAPSSPRFSLSKLYWVNSHHLRKIPSNALVNFLKVYPEIYAGLPSEPEKREYLLHLIRSNLRVLREVFDSFAFLAPGDTQGFSEQEQHICRNFLSILPLLDFSSPQNLRSTLLRAYPDKEHYRIIRKALSGKPQGIELHNILYILGAEKTKERIEKCVG
ncbi:MAG: glutamate--tRNA ligase [bacterium JZ-2024 1]